MRYEIRVKGQLDQQWSAWFEGLTISYDGEGNTILTLTRFRGVSERGNSVRL
jgi:hypothetical protein